MYFLHEVFLVSCQQGIKMPLSSEYENFISFIIIIIFKYSFWRCTFIHFQRSVCKIPNSEQLQLVNYSEVKMQKKASSAHKSEQVLSLRQQSYFRTQVLPISSYTILGKSDQKGRNLISLLIFSTSRTLSETGSFL